MSDKPKLELTRWADKAMFEAVPMRSTQPEVHLLWATPDPLGAIAAACRMYEGKPTYDLREISNEERHHYWDQIQQTHLQAPLEFVKFHFFLEGIDRSFTHQAVRQRTAVFAQESLRFAVKENLAQEVVVPPSILTDDDIARGVWDDAVKHTEEAYNYLVNAGIPAEDARGLLPHAVATRFNYCTDLRNLLEHAGNRLCTQAQFHWRAAFIGIVNAIKTHHTLVPDPHSIRTQRAEYDYPQATVGFLGDGPVVEEDKIDVGPPRKVAEYADDATGYYTGWQFKMIAESNVFKPVCFRLGRCPYMAVFDRQCTIRERVNKGEFDKISPDEYMADASAGRRD